MSIAITGASGTLGRLVVEEVLQRRGPEGLVLITRSPERLSEFADRGAEVRRGDFAEPDGLAAAFVGVERLLLISTDAVGSRLPAQEAAIAAADAAGVGFVAYTSIPNPGGNVSAAAPDHFGTEEALRASGIGWAFLRNSIYADLEAGSLAAAAATGKLVTNNGGGSIAYVGRRECAEVAAEVLTGEGHEGAVYEITGPELVDSGERAAIFRELAGRPVEVVQVEDERAAELAAEAMGVPLEVGRIYASFGRATREGQLEALTDTVERITGKVPRDLRSVLQAA